MKQYIKCPKCGKPVLARELHTPDPTIGIGGVHNSSIHWNHGECGSGAIEESVMDPVPAISIRQPWAWLIINGYKDIENRDYMRNLKGDYLIHTGKTVEYHRMYDYFFKYRKKLGLTPDIIDRMYSYEVCGSDNVGGIVGYMTITGYVEESDSPWFMGKYGLLIKDSKPLPFACCKGQAAVFYPKFK